MALLAFIKEFYTLIFVWLSCLTALFVYRSNLPHPYRWFLLFIIFMGIAETTGNYLAHVGFRNQFYFNVFYIIQFLVIPLFFYQQLQAVFFKKAIRGYFFLFPLFAAADILWLQSFTSLLTYTFVAGSSFVLVLAIAYFWQLYVSDETASIWYYPVFWISLAYVFYYAIALPYIGMLNYLWVNYPDFTRKYYLVFNLVIILQNLFLTAGFLCLRLTTVKR